MAGLDSGRVSCRPAVDNLKLGAQKPPMPFSDARLLNLLSHTFWFLPSVASCHAMRNLLAKKQNRFYHDYKVIVAAGNAAGIGVAALPPGTGGDGRSPQNEDHHPVLRQIDHGRDGETVDGHSHAAQFLHPGNLFSGGLPGAVALDDPQPGRRSPRTRNRSSRRNATSLTLRRTGRCGRSPTTVAG